MRTISCVAMALCAAAVWASDVPQTRQSLKGLGGVSVAVEESEAMKHVGLDSGKVKAAVEAKLKAAGIKVLSDAERLKAPGSPYLSVNLNANEGKNGVVSFGLALSLFQGCALARDANVKLAACDTWSRSKVGHASSNVPQFIEDLVSKETDSFVKAYTDVNPHSK